MSKRILGVVPKSGEKMLKDAIGQFRGIISQIQEGIKKVKVKVAANDKKAAKIAAENERLLAAVVEGTQAAENLEALLNGKIMTLPTEDEVVAEDTTDATDEAVEADETEETPSDESK